MKFLLALIISMALALATSPLLFTEEQPPETEAPAEQAEGEEQALKPEPFTLENREGDSVEMAKFKASLRLLNAYTVTATQLRTCAASTNAPEVKKALSNYLSRNGTTMNQVMQQVKLNGGLTQEIRDMMDARAAELIGDAPQGGNCMVLVEEVAAGGEDLYKAPKYADDYKLMRSKTK
ncbi:hypothetical protein C4J81_16840 [Deltaproteobacteria bacterium Smac51]|nr:hypothetical protein C4J81_16840 [Deltaproteobacteria bacterium Smac51]